MTPARKRSLTTIVFSKNRACQLELLLRSLNIPVSVLYTYDPEFKAGYDKLLPMYPKVNFIKQANFRKQLIKMIKQGNEYVMFLVDDDIMVRPFWEDSPEFAEFIRNQNILCLSLRLTPDYRQRGLPLMNNNKWKWKRYSRESKNFSYRLRIWGFPMAVGANIFRKRDLLPMIEAAKEIKNPNYLEIIMQINIPNKPLALCFDKAKFINNEINQVQADFPQHTPGPSAAELEKRFLNGERLSLYDMIIQSSKAHDYFIKINYTYEAY